MDNKRVVIIVSKYGLDFVHSYISYDYVGLSTIKDILDNSKYPYLAFDNINWVEKVSYHDAIYFEQSSESYGYSVHLDLDTNVLHIYSNGSIEIL